jgi:hypothetical protein
MYISEDKRHNLLLVVAAMLFIIFSSGLARPTRPIGAPILIP